MAPDRKSFIAVTESGEAEIYNLVNHEFVAKIEHGTGPFRSIQLAVYYDRQSIALVPKRKPNARDLDRQTRMYIIPKLASDGRSESFQLRVITRPRSDIPNHSLGMLAISVYNAAY